VPFLIRGSNNCAEEVHIASNRDLEYLKIKASARFGVDSEVIRIGYRLTTSKKDDPTLVLDSDEALERLFKFCIAQVLSDKQKLAQNKKVAKPFAVLLENLSEPKKAGKKDSAKGGKKTKVLNLSLFPLLLLIDHSVQTARKTADDAEESGSDNDAAPKTTGQWILAIDKEYYNRSHQHVCIQKPGMTSCYMLEMRDRSTWATDLV
jgi:hypothetical protein